METTEYASTLPMTRISIGMDFWTTVATVTGTAAASLRPRAPQPLPAGGCVAPPAVQEAAASADTSAMSFSDTLGTITRIRRTFYFDWPRITRTAARQSG